MGKLLNVSIPQAGLFKLKESISLVADTAVDVSIPQAGLFKLKEPTKL